MDGEAGWWTTSGNIGLPPQARVIGGWDDPTILDISGSWDTVSKAAVKSMATHNVRCGGFRWLNNVSMSVVSWSRADVVECLGLKPCL